MQEKLIKWNPLPGINGALHITSITFDNCDLTLYLHSSENQKVQLIFKLFSTAYKCFNHHYCINKCTPLQCDHAKWSLFIVENSRYFKWLKDESFDIAELSEFTHFVIAGTNKTVDILSKSKHTIQFCK